MKYLAEKLEGIEGEKKIWFDQELGEVFYNHIACAIASVDSHQFTGKKIGLGKLSQIELAMSMIFFDGVAQSIALIPDEAEIKYNSSDDSGLDIIIEGDGIGLSKILKRTKPEIIHAPNTERGHSTKWILSTSGTTGVPKKIEHNLQSLTRTVRNNRAEVDLRWGSFYNLKRFAGLQVFLQSWISGDELILTDGLGAARDMLSTLTAAKCSALSATPSMWRNICMLPNFKNLNLMQITLGGEIADQAILNFLRREFPMARVTHIYASTEAGVGFAVNDGKAGFPIEYLSVPQKNNKLKIGENGNLHILPAAAIKNDAPNKEEWIDTGDAVCIKDDRVIFLGRSNGSINVGGNKLMPEEVESVIYELDSIAFVQIRARKSSILGNVVEAAVIPVSGINVDSALKRQIVEHCRRKLEGYKVPAFVVPAEEPVINSAGKLARGKVNE